MRASTMKAADMNLSSSVTMVHPSALRRGPFRGPPTLCPAAGAAMASRAARGRQKALAKDSSYVQGYRLDGQGPSASAEAAAAQPARTRRSASRTRTTSTRGSEEMGIAAARQVLNRRSAPTTRTTSTRGPEGEEVEAARQALNRRSPPQTRTAFTRGPEEEEDPSTATDAAFAQVIAPPRTRQTRHRSTNVPEKLGSADEGQPPKRRLGPPAPQPQPQDSVAPRPTNNAGVLLVVDGNYLANRAYFGYGDRGLSTSGGVPTSVTYGVLKTLQLALQTVQPAALAVVFDHRGPTFRAVMSLLDPSAPGPIGTAAAALARDGRLDWQALACRLLALESVRADLRAVGDAQAAATPSCYLQPDGAFLASSTDQDGPSAASTSTSTTAGTGAEEARDDGGGGRQDSSRQDTPGASASRAAGGWNADYGATAVAGDPAAMLAAALGPDLAAALGLGRQQEALEALEGLSAEELAEAEAMARLVAIPMYKAGRTAKQEDFHEDFRNLQRLLGLMSVPPLSRPWLEADDLAGLLVAEAVRQGMGVRILSGDRDFMQLVSDPHDVAMLYPQSKGAKSSTTTSGTGGRGTGGKGRKRPDGRDQFPFNTLREADVVAALGVAPGLVAEYKALAGDASDNLPGVAGVGPKTAASLLATYGSLAGVHAAVAVADKGIAPKKRASLQAALPASLYTLVMARVLGADGAPTEPPGVLPDGLLQRLALRGFDPLLVQPAMRDLEMENFARDAKAGGALWRDFGGC